MMMLQRTPLALIFRPSRLKALSCPGDAYALNA
jgi:hypothetical protein